MKSDEPLPLWLESIPDREPWRRGRIAVVLFTLLVAVAEAVLLLVSISMGNVTLFVIFAGFGVFYLALLYFVWVGYNWARWVLSPLFGLGGFANTIWSLHAESGLLFVVGYSSSRFFATLPSRRPSTHLRDISARRSAGSSG